MDEDSVSTIELKNGEYVGLSAICITAVPHISVLLQKHDTAPEVVESYKLDMSRLLSEVYQIYKSPATGNDISLEILWCAEPVEGQPFKARLNMFRWCVR